MTYFRCECGSYELFDSVGPIPCDPCDMCEKVPGTRAEGPKDPIDHDFVVVDLSGIQRCRRCNIAEEI
jgi:hypothetical protein